MKTLRDLLHLANAQPRDVQGFALPVDVRRALLGEFLELDQLRAAVWGHYDMETGEWALRTANRRRFIITIEKD